MSATTTAEPIQGLPGMQIITPEGNLFEDSGWSTTKPEAKAEPGKPEVKPDTDKPAPTTQPDADEIVDELEYLEKQTGYKSWDEVKATKTELEQLKAKPQTAAERKFANEKSKQLAEAWEAGETDKVYDFLHTERQLKKAAELSAADAIKLHLQQSNLHYKAADVEDVFKERYSMPKKPVQRASEETEEFQERMDEYTERVGMITRAIERDGIAAKQDLAKQITELVPPEIPKRQEAQGPSQEALDGRRAFIEGFVKALPKELENFKGFNTVFKDEEVEIPISYGISPEEIKVYQTKLEAFANANLDTNTLFTERWLNKDGTINASKAAEDLYVLDNLDKILSKVATETGNQRMKAKFKQASNIKVDGETKVVTMNKTEKGSQAEAIDKLWEQA
jgi:hypothetical protein